MENSLFDEFAFLGEQEPQSVDNSLYEWCMTHGEKGKQILSEWDDAKNVDVHNMNISPREVKRGSGKMAWWKCSRCGNEYQLAIRRRISYIVGCKECRTKGSSYSEMVIFYGIQAKFPKVLHRYKCGERNLEFDIVIPELGTYIEYSGEFWHKTYSVTDQLKRDYCANNNIRFIEIIELKKPAELSVDGDIISYKYSEHDQDGMLYKVLLELYKLLDVSDYTLDYNKVLNQAISRMLRPIKGSVLDIYPQLNNEFDEELNNGARLDFFTLRSAKRIKWRCVRCKNIWSSTIANRTEFKSGCTCCGYNVFNDTINKNAIRKSKIHIIPGVYSL